MSEKVPTQVKKDRNYIMIEQGERKKRMFYEKFLGKSLPVLFEQKNKDGCWTGYTSNYIQVAMQSDQNLHNKLIPVQLTILEKDQLIGI
jgi:threonylcarbamoyladenosine tRNA methylthiotransferase MtaB